MKVIIIEDEVLAQERLITMILKYDASIIILECLESIEESVLWLNTKPAPDLIFMDIHLSDGHSFEILKQVNLTIPIIFTTAYDNYAIEAFQHFSIDYILKPVNDLALAKALNKYNKLKVGLPAQYNEFIDVVKDNIGSNYKNRFLAKVGQRLFFIAVSDITYFYADNKVVYVHDRDNNKYIINTTIEKLEKQLNPKSFFRINRKYILQADAIEQVKPYINNRLIVLLKGITAQENLVISRERVLEFKTWAEQ